VTAPVETALADRAVAALRALPALAGFKVYANRGEMNARHPSEEGGCDEPCVVDVTVASRSYEHFTSSVATVGIGISGRVDFQSRIRRVKPDDVYLDVVGILEEWQGSIAAVKDALGSQHFDPVGLRLDGGGEWGINPQTKAFEFTVPFTVKGRVKKGN